MDVKTLLVPHTAAEYTKLKNSTILHSDPRLGLFAARTIEKEEAVTYYYGSLFYAALPKERYKTETYSKRIMPVTAETFRKLEK